MMLFALIERKNIMLIIKLTVIKIDNITEVETILFPEKFGDFWRSPDGYTAIGIGDTSFAYKVKETPKEIAKLIRKAQWKEWAMEQTVKTYENASLSDEEFDEYRAIRRGYINET
jgi:hypothetical protein